jgi:hypothetical protein
MPLCFESSRAVTKSLLRKSTTSGWAPSSRPPTTGGRTTSHAEYINYERKRERAKSESVQAWVNPEEYRQFIAKQKRAFEDLMNLEMGVKK